MEEVYRKRRRNEARRQGKEGKAVVDMTPWVKQVHAAE
jgi:hypothetical protein